MMVVNVHEAKTQLSKLLERVARGEEVVIGKAGTPVARLVPYVGKAGQARKPGSLKGRIWIASDFDDELPDEMMRAFRGEP